MASVTVLSVPIPPRPVADWPPLKPRGHERRRVLLRPVRLRREGRTHLPRCSSPRALGAPLMPCSIACSAARCLCALESSSTWATTMLECQALCRERLLRPPCQAPLAAEHLPIASRLHHEVPTDAPPFYASSIGAIGLWSRPSPSCSSAQAPLPWRALTGESLDTVTPQIHSSHRCAAPRPVPTSPHRRAPPCWLAVSDGAASAASSPVPLMGCQPRRSQPVGPVWESCWARPTRTVVLAICRLI
jgi:hypothetical protein